MLSIHCNIRIKSWGNRKTFWESIINKYNWKEIDSPSEKVDWKKFEKNNLTIAFNILYAKKEKMYPAYVSKNTK